MWVLPVPRCRHGTPFGRYPLADSVGIGAVATYPMPPHHLPWGAAAQRPWADRDRTETMLAVRAFTRWLGGVTAAGGGIASLVVLARTDAGGDARIGLAVSLMAGGAAVAAVLVYVVDGAWDVRAKQAWWPGRFAAVIPLALVPVISVAGFLMYPLTFAPGRPHDPSWLGVVVAMAFLVHPTGFLLGLGVMGLVAVPVATVVRCAPGALRGCRDDVRGVLLGLLLALLAPWAAVVVIGYGAHGADGAVVLMVSVDAGWWSVAAWSLLAVAASCVTALRCLRPERTPVR